MSSTPDSDAAAAEETQSEELDVARKAFYELRTISTSFGTDEESRSLAYYVNVTAPIMSKRSEPFFWSTLVTRAAWQHESVKYSLIAVAQMDEAFDIAACPITTGSSYMPNVTANNVRQKALRTYSTAVRAIISKPQAEIEVILLGCICLFTFENFIGSLGNATKHIEGAMSLVETWRKQRMPNGKGKNENVVMAKHVVPMLEAGVAYHRISLKAGKTAAKVMEPEIELKSQRVDWNRSAGLMCAVPCLEL